MYGQKIIKISNIPIQATKDQMYSMFECIGDIEDIQLYPKKRCTSFQSRICFIKFSSTASVGLAQYLNDTHLMDRLLQVTPFFNGKREEIPSEKKALEILMNDSCQINSHDIEAEGEFSSDIQKVALELQRNGLPPYPSLPFNCDPANVEEIRRTIVISNLDESISGQQVLEHFSGAGEVKYVRFCKRNSNGEFCCLVEFSKHESVIPSLKLNNTEIVKGRKVKVYHSVHAIEKYVEVILNGVIINRLASSLIEVVFQETVGERNSENIGQDHQLSSPSGVYSKSDSPSSRRSCKYRKYKYKRHRHWSKERRSKSSNCSGRSKSQEGRRHASKERRRSYKSGRESKRSDSNGRSLGSSKRCEKSKYEDRSSEEEKKYGRRSSKGRSKSLSRERPKSRGRTRSRSRQGRSRSKNWRSRSRSKRSRSRSRRSRSKSTSRFRKKFKSRERSRSKKRCKTHKK